MPGVSRDSRTDNRIERGNQTRRLVLARTTQIASVEGLEGLSLGRLAGELKLSKSGVFALFGSKEELQLATIRAATRIYVEHVINPVQDVPPGLGRVQALCDSWLDYSEQRVFSGGCFFYSVTAEYDARKGPVHDALAQARGNWLDFVEQTVEDAYAAGELLPDTDVPQLVFELNAFLEAANAESVLRDDFGCYARAARAVHHRLRGVAADPSLLPDTARPRTTR
jgi:AcrR family transcriptional regulator